ncbi:hypothetical protein ACLOAU_12270 [Niabella sp. CJ426]|uniref:hypothetical protein n=1 Tax=Niabella sp. CJ426 TaxID=3393740 RepID=UPI003D0548AA
MKRSMIDLSHTLKESFGQGDARLTGWTGMCEVPRPTGVIRAVIRPDLKIKIHG